MIYRTRTRRMSTGRGEGDVVILTRQRTNLHRVFPSSYPSQKKSRKQRWTADSGKPVGRTRGQEWGARTRTEDEFGTRVSSRERDHNAFNASTLCSRDLIISASNISFNASNHVLKGACRDGRQ